MSERIQIDDLIVSLGDPYPRFIRIESGCAAISFSGTFKLALLINALQEFEKIILSDESKRSRDETKVDAFAKWLMEDDE